MIRREGIEAPQGQWLLIAQADHARLAGELAEAWRDALVPASSRPEWLAAVYHHDDGWPVWDASPAVDQEHGRPIQFTEMPLVDSLAIWQRSIEAVGACGPLAAWMVSGHFSALLRYSNAWQATPHRTGNIRDDFLQRQDAARANWLTAWQRQAPATHTPALAQRGLELLQFFDALSLWFCCSAATQPKRMNLPDGNALTLLPKSSNRVIVEPWPFDAGTLRVAVQARAIPIRRYADALDLANAPSTEVELGWTLVSAEQPA
jgi:hypothetical protein